jgi:hypothetical protein
MASVAAKGKKKASAASKLAKSSPVRKRIQAKRAAAAGKSAPASRKAKPPKRESRSAAPVRPALAAGLTEEERIESSKYVSREVPRRLFEEERFLFPESYGVSRVRLLVKDPQWLFAHWDVAGKAHKELRAALGERPAALATLTLRVTDPVSGGVTTILLPKGARSWYLRTDGAARAYRAELGLTLPSGEFRHLAWSNTVETPRVGPARRRARHVVRFDESGLPPEEAVAETKAGTRTTRPWAGHRAGRKGGSSPERDYAPEGFSDDEDPPARGGASDTFNRGGASDVHRR